MSLNRLFCCACLLLGSLFGLDAQSVMWVIRPEYDSLELYSDDTFICSNNGYLGIIDERGNVILPLDYDFILPEHEGITIFGYTDGDKRRLAGFLQDEKEVVHILETFYLVPSFEYFSEGKLCVANEKGEQGFIDTSGNTVVRCQFKQARPFKEGFASVEQKRCSVIYIKEDYDKNKKNILPIKWNRGRIIFGSSFKDGNAVVGNGKEYMIIDHNGAPVRILSSKKVVLEDDYTVSTGAPVIEDSFETTTIYQSVIVPYSENGLYGYRFDNKTIIQPCFDSASPLEINQTAIVSYNGKFGIIRFLEKSISIRTSPNEIIVNPDGSVENMKYTLSIPEQYSGNVRFLFDAGNGQYEDLTAAAKINGNNYSFSFKPAISGGKESANLRCVVRHGNLTVFESEKTVSLSEVRMRLSGPRTTSNIANSASEQVVVATVHNDSRVECSIKVTLAIHCTLNKPVSRTFSITIPPESSKSVSTKVFVVENEDPKATIRLDSGESRTSVVHLRTY